MVTVEIKLKCDVCEKVSLSIKRPGSVHSDAEFAARSAGCEAGWTRRDEGDELKDVCAVCAARERKV